MTAEILYTGGFRTEAKHINSTRKIITDAPKDNQGKGEAFSPTDLAATALATCILTTIAIKLEKEGVNIKGAKASMQKIMASDPRRINEIKIKIVMPKNNYSESDKAKMEEIAASCPVALSLHPDINQDVNFYYQ